jgi:hypothetical protein
MSMPNFSASACKLGNRSRRNAGVCALMSRYTQSSPVRFISKSIARATTSRGARSFIGWWRSMNASPVDSRSTPPSPRSASLIRKLFAAGW